VVAFKPPKESFQRESTYELRPQNGDCVHPREYSECVSLRQPVMRVRTIIDMELSERQRKYLRGLGHALSPVLLIGKDGISASVVAEAKRALHDHELIKVKFRGSERDTRDAGLAELASATLSALVHRIGHTALYYKRRDDRPGIVIPDA
jgi:RNA-binding protein